MSTAITEPPLRFPPLTFLEEGDEVVVGRADTDAYVVLPADGAALLRQLQAGATEAEAASWYAARYGEPVDVAEFVTALRDLTLIRDLVPDSDEADTRPEPVRWQGLGRALFSPAAWVLYGMLVVAAVAVCVADPYFAPRREHVFFSDYLVLIELTIFLGQIPLTLLHELFHVLAGRRLGLRSRVRLSQRLYFVVFETVLDGLVVVPRRKRYLPMLAGLLGDTLVVAALTLIAWTTRHPDGGLTLVGGVCLALAFTTLPRMAWQFYFFLRTDLYHLVCTVLGCNDLHTAARGTLRNRANALIGRRDRIVDEEQWHPRDRQVARWYAPLVVVGYAWMLAVLAILILPLAWEFLGGAVQRAFLGAAQSTAQQWDAAILLALTVAQLVLAGALAVRERRRRQGQETGYQATTPTTKTPTTKTPVTNTPATK